jgi:hypothetical protein
MEDDQIVRRDRPRQSPRPWIPRHRQHRIRERMSDALAATLEIDLGIDAR